MKTAIRAYCTLFLLSTSVAFSQTTPGNTAQSAGTAAASPAMAAINGDPAVEANLQKMETELDQAAAAHDSAPFVNYLDDNIVALGPGWKAANKADVLEGIKSTACTVTNPTVSGFTYKWLAPDLVLVSYAETQSMTCNGKTAQAAEHDNSLWQKKNGKWMAIFHQGTADAPSTTNSSD